MNRAIIFVAALAAFLQLLDTPLLMDEVLHERQIQNFAHGNFHLLPRLEMMPGFHFLFAAIVALTGLSSPTALRMLSLIIALVFLAACYQFARCDDESSADRRLAQIFTLPILFPFLFLLYTDVLALCLVVSAALAAKKDRPLLGPILGTAALCVRQNHLFWVVLAAYLSPGRKISVYWLVPLLVLVVFIFLNGGIAVNAPGAGVSLQPNFGNILFFLFLLPILFLPRFVFECTRIHSALKNWRVWVAAVAVFLVAFYGFSAPHPFNRFAGHLRTDLILAIENDFISRLDFSVLATLGMVVLCTFSFPRGDGAALAVCTLLSLLPLKLIEQRYFLPSLVFGLLLKQSDRSATEWAQIFYWSILAFVFFEGIVRGWWYP